MKKAIALILAATMLSTMFAGCGNSDETPTSQPEGQGGASGDVATDEPVLAETQEYVTYLSSEPMTLDLNKRSDTYSSVILTNVLEGLTRMVANEDNTAYEYVPAGAKSWSSNEEGTVWTFELNENYWSDGVKVTADDYVYSMRRYVDPNTASPNGYRLDFLLNYDAVNKGEMALEDLGVKAIDEDTLEITLTNPVPYFMDLTHAMYMRPQRQDIVEANGDKYGSEVDTLVFNGPYLISSWTHNSEIILEKNPQYWDAENVTLDKVTVKIITDASTAQNAFYNGELDYISTGTAEWIEQYKAMDDVTHVNYPSATLTYSFFNTDNEIFQNEKIRKAFITAIDRVELNEMCFGGTRIPTYGWVVPTLYVGDINYREYAGNPIEEMIAETPDPKALLLEGMAELGLGDDPAALDFTFNLAGTDDWFRTLGEYLQQSFKTSLGVNLEIEFSDWGIFIDKVERGDYQMGFMSWGAGVNDPIDVLMLHTSESNSIHTGWANEEYDALIEQASIEMDDEKRAALYDQAEDILLKEHGVANPLATSTLNLFYYDNVMGYDEMPLSTGGYKYMYIVE